MNLAITLQDEELAHRIAEDEMRVAQYGGYMEERDRQLAMHLQQVEVYMQFWPCLLVENAMQVQQVEV